MTNEEIMQIIDNDDAWDTGALGRDEKFARLVKLTPEREAAIDEAVGLQLISIRLPKALIEDFKFIGASNGIKYQTLMRQILDRFANSEKKNMAKKAANAQIKASQKAAKTIQEQLDQEHSQLANAGDCVAARTDGRAQDRRSERPSLHNHRPT